ncbi:MAG: hypothetical protein PHV11_06320 [Candidatus Bipolaricaulis sp.]|nr:hypothetical protein [Candidatus Bipolaricaulis sp.]
MPASALDASKVSHSRIKTIDFLLNTSSVWGRTGLKDSVIETCSETKVNNEIELDDGTKIYEPGAVHKLEFVIVIPELDTDDLAEIEKANNINLVTSGGGTNGTGVKIAAALSYVRATCDGFKTRIRCISQKTDSTRPWTITANAA